VFSTGSVGGGAAAGYEILEELGRGGMGVVYKARQTALKRIVALKMVLAGMHAGPDELKRFRREAEAIARIQHPNIVQIYEVGTQEELPFFSMEYVDGGSLADQLDGNAWGARKAGALLHALARAVHAAHQQNIIHRDLKPANILMTANGVPKITDFGLVKQLDDGRTAHTRTGAILGTPSYMAPEQAGGTKEIGPTADVYGLGAILYELLTGRPPFQAGTHLDTILLVISEEPVPPSRLRPNVDRDLETICLKCLQKDPEKRYPSAAALANDLRRFRVGDLIRARQARPWERALVWMKRRPLTMSVAGVVSAAVLVLGIVVLGLRVHFADEEQDLRNQFAEKQQELQASADREQSLRAELDQARNSAHEIERNFERARKDITASSDEVARLKQEIDQGRDREKKLREKASEYAIHLNNESWKIVRNPGKQPEDYELALSWSELAEGFDPGNHNYLNTVGVGLYRVGKYAEAREKLLQSERINSAASGRPLVENLAFLAMSAQKLGKKAEAVSYLEKLRDKFDDKAWIANLEAEALLKEAEALIDPESGRPPAVAIKASDPIDLGKGWADRFDVNVLGLQFTPDGHHILVGGDVNNRPQPNLWFLSIDAKMSMTKMGSLLGHGGWVNNVAISPDGKSALSASQDGTVILWDLQKHIPLRRRADSPNFWRHAGPVNSVAFSPDGTQAVSACADKLVRVWSLDSMVWKCKFSRHTSAVSTVGFSNDGKQILSTDSERTVLLWDKDTLEIQDRFPEGGGVAAFSPDGKWIVSGGENQLWLWDRTNGSKWRLRGEQKEVNYVCFSPDSQHILVTDSGTKSLFVWDVAARKQICKIAVTKGTPNRGVFGPDGKSAACGTWRGHLLEWRLSN
jgi:serine/threonine protein kinase